jgi:hypothetical protein
VFINIGRGNVVSQTAITRALEQVYLFCSTFRIEAGVTADVQNSPEESCDDSRWVVSK